MACLREVTFLPEPERSVPRFFSCMAFSTFSLDVALLYERGEAGMAALYVLLSVALSIGGLFAGLALVRNFV